MKKEKKRLHAPLAYRAEKALKRAVAKAIDEHRRQGIPIAVWRDGKVVRVEPDQLEIREPQAAYGMSRKKAKQH